MIPQGRHPVTTNGTVTLVVSRGPVPISIRFIEELQRIGISEDYPADDVYEIAQDINAWSTAGWNGGQGFRPIPIFLGRIEGGNHKIIGLTINRPDENAVGLVSCLMKGGTIQNLEIQDCVIYGGNGVGAIAGQGSGFTISGCSVYGTVEGQESGVGGVIGYAYNGDLMGTLFQGTVTGKDEVGGIAGYAEGSGVAGVFQCATFADVYGENNVGGLIGTVRNGVIVQTSFTTGTVRGKFVTGGVAGYDYGGTFTSTFSAANVLGGDDVGGFSGWSEGSTYSSCYAAGWVVGENRVGGFSGFTFSVSYADCYASGPVVGTSDVGGLVGLNDSSTATDCFWDVHTSGQSSSALGVGLSASAMRQQGSFTGWDFSTVWGIDEGVSRPWLQWQVTQGQQLVEDFSGLAASEAISALEGLGFSISIVEICSDTVSAGNVVFQYPAGYVLPPLTITLYVSNGACDTVVPDVVGMDQASAEADITSVGLVVGTITSQCSDTLPAGTVVSQYPTGGSPAASGTSVNLVLSSGPCDAIVPDVVGLTQTAAQSSIEGAGLVVGGISSQYSQIIPVGCVISTIPSAGTQVTAGTQVNVVISLGVFPPPNDACENAFVLSENIATTGTNANATGTDITSCGSNDTSDVWYVWTASASGTAVVDTCGSLTNFDTVLAVFDACGGTEVVCNDDGCGTASRVVFPVSTGETYFIRVAGYSGVSGTFELLLRIVPPVLSDLCEDALPLETGVSTIGDSSVADGTDITSGCGVQDTADVWYAWMPGVDGTAIVDTCGGSTDFDTVLAVFDACGGTELACNDDACETHSQVVFPVTKDQTYLIRVAGYGGGSGVFELVADLQDLAVPDVVKREYTQAEDVLTSAFLSVGTVTYECSNSVPASAVISQNPAAGTTVTPGTFVDLVVSSGACPVMVPDVVGQTQSAAEAALTSAGLVVGTVTEACSDSVPAGSVISQDPASGDILTQRTS